jgi:hypothetical protein
MDKLKRFHEYATERALKTFAQTMLASMSVGAVGLLDVDWANVVSISALAMIMSQLTSVLQYDRKPISE